VAPASLPVLSTAAIEIDDGRIPSSGEKAMVLLQRDVRYREFALGIADGLRSRFPQVWPRGARSTVREISGC